MSIVENNDLFLNISGFNFLIRFYSPLKLSILEESFVNYVKKYFSGFILSKKPEKIDFYFNLIEKDRYESMINITKGKLYIAIYEEKSKNSFNLYSHISNIQLNIVFRIALQRLLAQNFGFIIHTSCVIVDEKAYLFMGKSGAGKSTSMQILSKNYRAFADDSVIIRKYKKKYFVYATPYPEKNTFFHKSFEKYELGKVFFLKKANEYSIKEIKNIRKIISELSEQFFTEQEYKNIQQKNFLDFINIFDKFYELKFSLQDNTEMIKLIKEYE